MSGILAGSRPGRAAVKVFEESGDCRPGFLPAREAAPVRADQTNQLVTFVDGDEETIAASLDMVHHDRFDIALHLGSGGALRGDMFPRIHGQQRFNAATGAGIYGADFPSGAAAVSEAQI